MKNLDITKMITISTAHITKETADILNASANYPFVTDLPVIYTKGEYGYMIHIPEYYGDEGEFENMPLDLYPVMNLAKENDCEWLCLDRDGEFVDSFETYDW